MYRVLVLSRPKGSPGVGEEWQLESRCLQDAVQSLSPDSVLVRVLAAGVCHTDLHLWHGYYKVKVL